MMKTLANPTSDSENNTEMMDSLEMKCLSTQRESPSDSSQELASLENSVNSMDLKTTLKNNSLLNSHVNDSSSLPFLSVGEASSASQESGSGGLVPDQLQKSLKRQGLTVNDLLQSAPPFALEWKSVRDVFQCSTCSSPIDSLSRKVSCVTLQLLQCQLSVESSAGLH